MFGTEVSDRVAGKRGVTMAGAGVVRPPVPPGQRERELRERLAGRGKCRNGKRGSRRVGFGAGKPAEHHRENVRVL
jgi:hypothetical protein